jgi:two-component system nitrate/nitrite sensor histidine kinase NarX
LLDANQAVRQTVTLQQTTGYNVLEDEYLVAAGMMDDIRRAFAGDAVRLAPLHYAADGGPGLAESPPRWVRGHLYPVKDEAGAVRDVVAMVEDVTEQVQTSQLLEQRVEERTHELSTLLAVSQNVASTLELEPLLAVILDHLGTVTDYMGAAIFLVEGDQLIPRGYRGPLSIEHVARLRFPVAEAVGFQEVLRGDPLVLDDLQGDDPLARAFRAGPSGPLYATFRYVRSLMVVPLRVKDRVIGVIGLAHGEPHHYTPRHATLALTIANQAAMAIENARLYARAQEVAALEERARLARELHDSVTQTLFSASLIAEVLPRLWRSDPEAGRLRLEDVRVLTRGALAEMRTLLLELRPAALTDAKLSDLLRQLAEALAGRKKLPVALAIDGDECPLPADVQVALYRVAQEALNNSVRHARATRVEVRLRCRGDAVELTIGDDGRGFEAGRVGSDHFGLRIMGERATAVGAALAIESRPGQGTQVQVVWPGNAAAGEGG